MKRSAGRYQILVDVGGLLAEEDDDLMVRGYGRTHQHVDDVDDVEADHLPQLDLLVEEHEDEIHRGHLRLRRILSITM